MNELTNVFQYGANELRTVIQNEETWFAAKDVCEVLELSNVSVVISRLDEDEVTKFNLGGLSGETNFVNEAGLYTLILSSRKPEAKQFKRWITHEVIPSIRKTGQYVKPLSEREQLVAAMKLSIESAEEIAAVKEDVAELKLTLINQLTLDHGQQVTLQHAIKQRVESIKNDYEVSSSRLYNQIHSHLRRAFAAPKYMFVKRKDFQEAMLWVKAWRPLL